MDERAMTKKQDAGNGLPVGAGILARADGATIAFHRLAGSTPGVVFLHGWKSDMTGGKALALEEWCRATGRAFLRFDTFGHGQSSGDVDQGTVGRWLADCLAAVDELTEGPQVVVGSSLGGWLALLLALERRDRVAGLVGVAAAPDFTEDLVWQELSFEQRDILRAKGHVDLPNCYDDGTPYRVGRALIEEGRNHLLLRDAINLACPVRLIQGQKDMDVPWETALRIADCLAVDDVEVTLVKDGDHRLSRPEDLARLVATVARLVEKVA